MDIRKERESVSAYFTYLDPCAMNKKGARPPSITWRLS
ncbi:hypothetical protein F4827_004071 [Paraburkholderia bannensis]|uniref:Uncharacterized protein n=1 Tax=Paraburkholderia bannensis TaxID=765414 RepID=A0A7W9TZF7_9BURK|nr:hypothetical protein [Paraburkholderia sp. WP4_3_2]MBB6104212.1 hypothetical protein [Paraburkholderia bannensis]